ncbi:MAG: restriction endonuclease [Acidimicrobiales bacterium]
MKAFISAPPGQATDAIRRALVGLQIEPVEAEKLIGGGDWNTWIRNAIDNADVVVVVLPNSDAVPPAFMFETGVAVGLGKPVLVVVPKSRQSPLAFTGLREVRANLDDVEAITLGLSAFLGLGQVGRAGPEATLRRRTPQPELGQWLDVKLRELQTVTSPTSQGHQLEQIVAELFRESGAEVQVAERGPDRGIDMAVMFGSDEPFGGVLFVQVKRTQSHHAFRNAMAQLQAAVIDRGTQLGLLVYWSPIATSRWFETVPLVVALDLTELPVRLGSQSLVEVVAEERNRAIHAI